MLPRVFNDVNSSFFPFSWISKIFLSFLIFSIFSLSSDLEEVKREFVYLCSG